MTYKQAKFYTIVTLRNAVMSFSSGRSGRLLASSRLLAAIESMQWIGGIVISNQLFLELRHVFFIITRNNEKSHVELTQPCQRHVTIDHLIWFTHSVQITQLTAASFRLQHFLDIRTVFRPSIEDAILRPSYIDLDHSLTASPGYIDVALHYQVIDDVACY